MTVSSKNIVSISPFQSMCFFFFFFSYLTALASTSIKMLTSSGESRLPCFIPHFKGKKAFSVLFLLTRSSLYAK